MSGSPLLAAATAWIEIAMVIFMVVFLGIVAWTLLARPGAFHDASRIPLDDQDVMTPRDDATGSGAGERPGKERHEQD